MNAERPVFLDLARIRFPVGAVASMGHRVSGVARRSAYAALIAGAAIGLATFVA